MAKRFKVELTLGNGLVSEETHHAKHDILEALRSIGYTVPKIKVKEIKKCQKQ